LQTNNTHKRSQIYGGDPLTNPDQSESIGKISYIARLPGKKAPAGMASPGRHLGEFAAGHPQLIAGLRGCVGPARAVSHRPAATDGGTTTGGTMVKAAFAKEQLKSFIERIERLEEERAALSADIREVYAEAKGDGFDTKIMRQVVRLRKLDKADYQEQEALLDLYKRAMDMID
jgi:uncharacterized protein (UPF0335 family)